MNEHFDEHTASRPLHRDSKAATGDGPAATLPEVAPAGRARPERDARRLSFVAGGLVRRVELLLWGAKIRCASLEIRDLQAGR